MTAAADKSIGAINWLAKWTHEEEEAGRSGCTFAEIRDQLRWILELHGLREAEGEE
jgi:hypothetical protein